ncbi:2-keto-4-pentenoate hydratase [Pseudonocardia acaciae]|uniref:2-keto-4-pentenoate hydratase n=1 Tax=Pseudonocardia acaciae TaxID=551276 RepID=UPI000684E27C|nr:fumarylacetoacetate hydrolase family protein [Pseudonocardia acaciae]
MTIGHDSALVDRLAADLGRAWEDGHPIDPLNGLAEPADPDLAYAVQARWTGQRVAGGDRVVGHKIGLTSLAMQEQMGVDEPDYGSVLTSRVFEARRGVAEMPVSTFIQPRVEGELAFLLGRGLVGPHVTAQQVLAATDAVAAAVEVVDSRIKDWKISLFDTIADNASYGGLAHGRWDPRLRTMNLRTVGMIVRLNGRAVVEATGSAALGGPARAVAWLANKLTSHGVALEPGQLVLSGSLGRAFPVAKGDCLQIECTGQPMLTTHFV